MKELLVISGKGGTGKTTIVGSLAVLAENKVLADCDVDAADLHLLLQPQVREVHEFYGLPKAVIDPETCTGCGRCMEVCRFGAVQNHPPKADLVPEKVALPGPNPTNHQPPATNHYWIDPARCEGCRVCYHICPAGAISLTEHCSGYWYVSTTPYGTLVHAALGIAEENSGKLVTQVRQRSRELAKAEKAQYLITDGPPGVGCPVIASLADIDLALIVTEPTVAGQHDLDRVLTLTEHFQVPAAVCVNKYDLEPDKTAELVDYCRQRGIPILGRIPFRPEVNQAVIQGRPVVEYCRGPATLALEELWEALKRVLQGR